MHVPSEWADDIGRPAKRRVAARIGCLSGTMESIHAELDKGGIIRDGMTVFGRVMAMVERLREYDETLSVADGAMPRLPTRLARIKRLVSMARTSDQDRERLAAVERENADLRTQRAAFHTDYRAKFDVKTKEQAVRIEQLECEAKRLREAVGLLDPAPT
jgi:hypothetical protein